MPARRPVRPPATSAPRSDAEDAADRLHSTAIRLLRRVRREDDASGLSAPQLSALSVVVHAGPITLGALAKAEQVRPPTMTRIVAWLEARGLVRREGDSADRRVARVSATAAGRRMLEEGRARRVSALAEQLAALPARELAVVRRAVGVLEGVLGERRRGSA